MLGLLPRLKLRFSTRSPTPLSAMKSFRDFDTPTGVVNISMFCSVNRGMANDSRIKYLREFVLNKDATCLPKDKYHINMYLCKPGLQRFAPFSVQLLSGGNHKPIINCISEIATYPIGFILCFNPTEVISYDYPDVTLFSDYKYEDECSVELQLPYLECNIMFPADFRSKEEIQACTAENKSWNEAHPD